MFADPSNTTAVASDVASGKQFLKADGSYDTGTASGGGGGTINIGALRGDATRVVHDVINRRVVQDDGLEIPAYSTTQVSLGSSPAQRSIDLGVASTNYDYLWLACFRGVGIVEYRNTQSLAKGVPEWFASVYGIGLGTAPQFASRLKPSVKSSNSTPNISDTISATSAIWLCYGSSSSALNVSNSSSIYTSLRFSNVQSTQLSLTTANGQRIVKYTSPYIFMKGNSSYFSQSAWENVADIHYQFVLDVWRVPNNSGDVRGFSGSSNLLAAMLCGASNGTLT